MKVPDKVKEFFGLDTVDEGKKTFSAEIINIGDHKYFLLDEETFATLLALSGVEDLRGEN